MGGHLRGEKCFRSGIFEAEEKYDSLLCSVDKGNDDNLFFVCQTFQKSWLPQFPDRAMAPTYAAPLEHIEGSEIKTGTACTDINIKLILHLFLTTGLSPKLATSNQNFISDWELSNIRLEFVFLPLLVLLFVILVSGIDPLKCRWIRSIIVHENRCLQKCRNQH